MASPARARRAADPTARETPGPSAAPDASKSPYPSAAPAASKTPDPSAAPAADADVATPEPDGDAEATDPPEIDLVVPEEQGAVVTPAKVKYTSKGLRLAVEYPAAPGLYRLVATLHASSGIAFDAATQALLAPVLVRIGGPVGVAYGVTPNLSVRAGAEADLPVRVMNSGLERWDQEVVPPPAFLAGEAGPPDQPLVMPANLVATWVSVSGTAIPSPAVNPIPAEAAKPGGEAIVRLRLTGPPEPGQYLLLLDVVSPSQGSILAHGGVPALVRVMVEAAPAPTATRGAEVTITNE